MDYQTVAPVQQMELQFALRTGTIPLFIPGFMGGQSASALTQGALFHPLSHVAALMPGYWNGSALEWMTLLKLLELGAAQAALFLFLLRLPIRPVLAFLVSFTAAYNLRMLDSFRYNVALDASAAVLLLCAALGLHYLERGKRWPKVAIAVSVYLVLTSGHPQWAFLGLIGAAAYGAALPWVLEAMDPALRVDRRGLVAAVCSVVVGGLLASAYTIPFYFDFMRNNEGRVGQGFEWAMAVTRPISDVLGSVFDPLHSDVHGAFGGPALFIVVLAVPALLLFRVSVPPAVLALWGLVLAVILAASGTHTPLYRWLYDHVPLWSAFRIPGRTTLVLIPPLLLLLAWVFATPRGRENSSLRAPLACSVAVILLLGWRLGVATGRETESVYSPHSIRHSPAWADSLLLGTGVLGLALLVVAGRVRSGRTAWEIAALALAVGQAACLMYWGTWQSRKLPMRTLAVMSEQRRHAEWLLDWPEDLVLRWGGLGSAPMEAYLRVADRDSRLAWIAHGCLAVPGLQQAYSLVRDRRWPGDLVLETTPDRCASSGTESGAGLDQVILADVSFNRVAFVVAAAAPGFLAVNIPYTTSRRTYWSASVDGASSPIRRGNGIMQVVAVPAGKSRVELHYWSWAAFTGMLLSTVAAVVIILYGSGLAGRYRRRPLVGALSVAAAAMMLSLWCVMVRGGARWGTQYVWTNDPSARGSFSLQSEAGRAHRSSPISAVNAVGVR